MEKRTPRLTLGKLAVYLLAFYLVWTLREFFLRQQVNAWLGPWGGALMNGATKLLIWTVPALLMIQRYAQDMAYPELAEQPVRWGRVLLWMAVLVGANLLASLVAYGRIGIVESFEPVSLIGTVLLVGITEETVFRGLLLNTLLTRWKPMTALVVSGVLFVLIHFPIWITKGVFAAPLDVLRSSVSIFVLSMIFGHSFMKEKNLLPPILLHMAWNLAVILFVGD